MTGFRSTKSRKLASERLEDRRMLATITVTNLNDNGPGSLRDAMFQLESIVARNEILFDPSLAGGTIHLQQPLVTNIQGSTNTNDELTIDATDIGGITIDLNSADPTPDIDDGRGIRAFLHEQNEFEIRGLTITGGDVTGRGGAIESNANLQVSNSVFTDNAAGEGGAIYGRATSSFNSFNIGSSRFTANRARGHGGAVSSGQTIGLRVFGSLFEDNTAANGGGLSSGEAVITGSQFVENSAVISGGGAYFQFEGGLFGSGFLRNMARTGGGVFAETEASVRRSTFRDNVATVDGGGLAIAGTQSSDTYFQDALFENNRAERHGGGALVCGELEVQSSLIAENTAGQDGGAIYACDSSSNRIFEFLVHDSTIAENASGRDGGGIFFSPSADNLFIERSTIAVNSAARHGGGLHLDLVNSDVEITQSTLTGNHASGNGGGVYSNIDSASTIQVSHSTIANNVADADLTGDGAGGGWFFESVESSPRFSHVLAADNRTGEALGDDLNAASATQLSSDFNLIESLSTNVTLSGSTDVIGVDPQLLPLADNGGPTVTLGLAPTSVAIDAGDPDSQVSIVDQRWRSRFGDGLGDGNVQIDIGAFEFHTSFALPVDLNGDDALGCADVDLLTQAVRDGSTDPTFDLDANGVIDFGDLDFWLEHAGMINVGIGFIYGDGNLDGGVDIADFNIWNENKFTDNGSWCSGDYNLDGTVDVSDSGGIWNSNKFTGGRPPIWNPPNTLLNATNVFSPNSTDEFDDQRAKKVNVVDRVFASPENYGASFVG